ncbi:MAG: aminotransferase class III-fold pyridoxal phosphate-dependent enzyme [Microvirga sp.]
MPSAQNLRAANDAANPNDLAAWWLPFTPNRAFKARPRLISGAKGMHYYTPDGRAIIDGAAGLWCCNAGHNRDEIVAAIQQQAADLDFAPAFQFGHPKAFTLASRIAELAPGDLEHVFFTNSGSEAVDTALKIALAYWNVSGQGQRTRLIGRERGYHGVGFGGISVGGLVNNRRIYPLLASDHLRHTHDPARNAFSRGLPEHGAEWADELEQLVALHGAETIAAVMVEPVAGAGGVLPPPKGYLERLRALCDKHGILLIFDEVITGFGRTGAAFAATLFGVTPDIMTTAKGITNAAIPCGAVFASRQVHDTVVNGGAQGAVEFFHGYTYSGHPVACAVAVANIRLLQRLNIVEHVRDDVGPYLASRFEELRDHPLVGHTQACGLMGAVQMVKDKASGTPFASDLAVGMICRAHCFANGLVMRAVGDRMIVAPPLVITRAQVDELVTKARLCLDLTLADVTARGWF